MPDAGHQKAGFGIVVDSPKSITFLRKCINIIGCFLCLPLHWLVTFHGRWPATLDITIAIALTELNRWVNERRRIKYRNNVRNIALSKREGDLEINLNHAESLKNSLRTVQCMAAVVGWREDPALFQRALESYQLSSSCTLLLVGIDGDEMEDFEMVKVFNKVYPHGSRTFHVPEPLGEVALRVRATETELRRRKKQSFNEDEINAVALRHCVALVRSWTSTFDFSNPKGIRQICIRQRHTHKKGIMFTSFVFALVISEILGIEFLWSSDSDTLVTDSSLRDTINVIADDPTIGGGSSGLVIHNRHETVITKITETVYWSEIYLNRSLQAATATSDCQSGPSTMFRLCALPPILIPWYSQTVFGKRMIINEDRHLTTNLLSRGWGIIFASDALTATETPTTLTRWLRQQVRWARATHIESLLQPKAYLMSHPLLFYGMIKREVGPTITAIAISCYFLSGKQIIKVSISDLSIRCLACLVYNAFRNPYRLEVRSFAWVVPGILFYHGPLPAIHIWSMMTLTAGGWGTSMRSRSESAKRDSISQAWFETGFFVVWMGVLAGVVARGAARVVFPGLTNGIAALMFGSSVLLASFLAWKVTVVRNS